MKSLRSLKEIESDIEKAEQKILGFDFSIDRLLEKKTQWKQFLIQLKKERSSKI